MSAETAWKVARERAAREAMQRIRMGGMPGFAQTVGEDILRLPMPPAFEAAVEAEMGELREALEAANSRAARFVKLFGDHATAMAMLLHVSERASVFEEGAFRSGYEAAIEEAGAYLDSSDEDGRSTAQTLVEHVIGLMNGSYGLIDVSAEEYEAAKANARALLSRMEGKR